MVSCRAEDFWKDKEWNVQSRAMVIVQTLSDKTATAIKRGGFLMYQFHGVLLKSKAEVRPYWADSEHTRATFPPISFRALPNDT